MASNSYGWATPTKTAGKGGGGSNDMPQVSTDMGMNRDIYGEQMGPGKNDPKPVPGWQMPQAGGNQALEQWYNKFGPNSPVNYADENARNMAEGYANYYAIPYLNAQMADRTQNFNEYNTGRNFDEQVRLNNSQMNLANAGSNREDLALQYGQSNNVRDYGEAQRQFNEQTRIDEMYKNGQIRLQDYQNATARLQANNDYALGQGKNSNELLGIQNQYSLGQQQDSTNRYGLDQNYQLGLGKNANEQQSINNQFALGMQNDATSRYGIQSQFDLGRMNDATSRYGMGLQDQQSIRSDNTNRYTVDQSTGVAREQNANTRYGMDLQNSQAGATNQTNRYGIDLNNQQQMRADSTNRYGMNLQNSQAQATNATNRYGMDQNYSLGMGQNANQAQANAALAQRYQGQTQNEAGANQNSLLNIQNQYALGQGGLSFQNRELDTNEAYRRSQLSQEADLTREKFKNDLVQSRYSAFGRAAAPNARALRSWY